MSPPTATAPVAHPADPQRRQVRAVMPAAVLVAAVAGMVVAVFAQQANPVGSLLVPVVCLPVILWRWPRAGVYLVMAAAVTVEQFAYQVGGQPGAATSRIPFFHSLTPGSGVTPAEILLFCAVGLWVLRTAKAGDRLIPRSPLSAALGAFLALIVVYLAYGLLVRHGEYKAAIWEIRPWFYLAVMYLLAAQLMTSLRAIRAVLWVIVVGTAAKAAYGIVIFLSVRNMRPRPEAVLAHEESFFFGVSIVLTSALWIFGIRGRLRRVATALLPVVAIGDMVNTRRVAWAILAGGVLAVAVVAYRELPHRRRLLAGAGVALLAMSALYLPLYWNKNGTLAQPARAVRTLVAPDPRDQISDQYRVTEDANLVLNIRATKDLGDGFGVPIDYQIPITNLTAADPAISFIPHNGVYGIWMRTGILGELLFWVFLSIAVIRSCQLARASDRETAMLGALSVAVLVAYVVMGDEDMGFFWFRIALTVGFFLGVVEAQLRRIAAAAKTGLP